MYRQGKAGLSSSEVSTASQPGAHSSGSTRKNWRDFRKASWELLKDRKICLAGKDSRSSGYFIVGG